MKMHGMRTKHYERASTVLIMLMMVQLAASSVAKVKSSLFLYLPSYLVYCSRLWESVSIKLYGYDGSVFDCDRQTRQYLEAAMTCPATYLLNAPRESGRDVQ